MGQAGAVPGGLGAAGGQDGGREGGERWEVGLTWSYLAFAGRHVGVGSRSWMLAGEDRVGAGTGEQ